MLVSSCTNSIRQLTFARLLDTVTQHQKNANTHNNFEFRIRTLAEDQLIGYTGLEVMWANQHAFVAIGIGEPEFWGKGYGLDAMQVILRYAFDELGLYRISLNVMSYNTRAIHLYEKIGFIHEGTQRECVYRDGQRWDLVYYGLLRHEWESGSRKS